MSILKRPRSNDRFRSAPVAGLTTTRQLVGFIRATHAGPTLVVTAATTALALAAGRGEGTLWVSAAVLAGQCSVGWSNDAIDADRDVRVNRLSKPVVAGLVTKKQIANASVAAFVLCVVLSLASGWRAAAVHIVAVLSAIAYNAKLKATVFSPVPYGISFALLPAFVTLGLPAHGWPQVVVMIATGTIGVGAHMVNAVADIDDDATTLVRGLPQRLGARRSLDVGAALLLIAGVLVAQRCAHRELAYWLVGVLAVVDGGVLLAGATARPRVAWRLAMLAAVICLAIFVVGGGSLVSAR